MRIGMEGAGNVGASLVMALASEFSGEVEVSARSIEKAEAAILDASSAYPSAIQKFQAKSGLKGEYDLVVVTAGAQPHGTVNMQELLSENLQLVTDVLSEASASKVVVIGTPVDRLTEALSALKPFTHCQVIGFGGQLDVDRTRSALIQRQLKVPDQVFVVGEHGPRAIPVYEGGAGYESIRLDATSVLKRIGRAGKARNIATGIQLSRLVRALAGERSVLCVSTVDKDFDDLAITWPRYIDKDGLGGKVPLTLERHAQTLLHELLQVRSGERKAIV